MSKTYTLGPMKQLVDLNGDITNFDLTFNVTSKNGSEFDAVVIDQTTLDNNPNPEYKKARGNISGNIVADKGVYQNYFLLLRADKPCECDVTIDIKEIPKRTENLQSNGAEKMSSLLPPKRPSSINWKMILLFIVVVGGGLLLFYYSKKKTDDVGQKVGDKFIGELVPESVAQKIEPSPKLDTIISTPPPPIAKSSQLLASPQITSTSTTPVKNTFGFGGRRVNESLIARLNSLPMRK